MNMTDDPFGPTRFPFAPASHKGLLRILGAQLRDALGDPGSVSPTLEIEALSDILARGLDAEKR